MQRGFSKGMKAGKKKGKGKKKKNSGKGKYTVDAEKNGEEVSSWTDEVKPFEEKKSAVDLMPKMPELPEIPNPFGGLFGGDKKD